MAVRNAVLASGNVFKGLLLFVIHNWGDQGALKIIQNCRQAMNPEAKLLLVETIMPMGNEPFVGKLIDIQFLKKLIYTSNLQYASLFFSGRT